MVVTPLVGDGISEDGSPKKYQLSLKSFEGGDCATNSENCVFWPHQVAKSKCTGDFGFVNISGQNKHKDIVCRLKCLKKEFDTMEDCETTCPLKCMTVDEKIKCQLDPVTASQEEEKEKES